jgi:hypothetical protein
MRARLMRRDTPEGERAFPVRFSEHYTCRYVCFRTKRQGMPLERQELKSTSKAGGKKEQGRGLGREFSDHEYPINQSARPFCLSAEKRCPSIAFCRERW